MHDDNDVVELACHLRNTANLKHLRRDSEVDSLIRSYVMAVNTR